jgi:16S rRNA (uracil1498-N3)-methyltransferase
MPRFYCPQPLATGATIDLPAAVAHHAWVVRLQPGAALTLFNGDGGEYAAQLAALDKKGATAVVLAHSARECELPYAVTLAQALPEAAKMDWIIEKAVELGVAAVQPLSAQRSVVKLSAERAEKRHGHWQGVIVAAAEQCGRNRLAALAPVTSVAGWLAAPAPAPLLLFSPRATRSLAEWASDGGPRPVCLMVGPEGGFSEDEEAAAVRAGAVAVSIGARVLRTETAALAALAALNALWGEM